MKTPIFLSEKDIEKARQKSLLRAGQVSPESALGPLAFRSSHVNSDSRSTKEGDFFIPIVGENVDGHQFIEAALAKGAVRFFYDQNRVEKIPSAILESHGIAVGDTLVFLGEIAKVYLSKLKLKEIIALTGSVGKTTVKSFAAELLSTDFKVHWSKKSFNNEVGVPSTILSCPEDVDMIVLEMGARHLGDIRYLCEIAEPTLVCVLNAGEAHLSEFGSRDNIAKGKAEIYRFSAADARLIVNADDSRLLKYAKDSGKKKFTFSMEAGTGSDYWLEDFGFDAETGGSHISIGTPEDIVSSEAAIYHETLGQNVLAAVAIAHTAGVSSTSLEIGITRLASEKGRFQINYLEDRDLILIDDTYNANPTSMRAGLHSLATLVKDGYTDAKVGLILGDMLELGEESPGLHEKVMSEALELIDPTAFVYVGKNYVTSQSSMGSNQIQTTCLEVDELLSRDSEVLDAVLKHCDIVYIKASNAIGLDRVVKAILERSR